MSEELGPLTLTIKVDKQTGAISVLNEEMKALGQGSAQNTASFALLTNALKDLGPTMASLAGPLATLGTIAGVAAFFKEASAEAEDYAQRLRFVGSELGNLKGAHTASLEAVKEWAKAIEQSTQFSEKQALETLPALLRATGDFAVAQRLSTVAQNTSVATGRDLAEVTNILAFAYQGNARGLMQLKRMLGESADASTNAGKFILELEKRYQGAAANSDTLTKAQAQLKNTFVDLEKQVGDQVNPTLTSLVKALTTVMDWTRLLEASVASTFNIIGSIIVTVTAEIGASLSSLVDVIIALLSGNFAQAKKIAQDGVSDVVGIFKIGVEDAKKEIINGGEAIGKIEKEIADRSVKTHKDASDTKGGFDTKDKAAAKKNYEMQLADLQQNLQLQLDTHGKTLAQKLRLTLTENKAEEAANNEAAKKGIITQDEAEKKNQKLHFDSKKAQLDADQKYKDDATAIYEEWARKAMDVQGQVAHFAVSAGDEILKSFSDSAAKTLLEQKSFADAMTALYKKMVEQILAELIKIAVEQAAIKITEVALFGFAEGGRVSKPTVAMIGEGGEPETVVPDSKAQLFAAGVMASGGDKASGSHGAAGGPVTVNFGDIHMSFTGTDMSDPVVRQQIMSLIGQELKKETVEAIQFASRSTNLSRKYQDRAV